MENTSSIKYPLKIKSFNSSGFFAGYASVYDKEDFHNDIIAKGAFEKSLHKANLSNIKLLWQHNPSEPIGHFSKIFDDNHGLYVEGYINLNLNKGREAYSLIKTGALDGLSVGFTVKDFELESKTNTRIILEAELWEISLVTFPANIDAKIKIVKNLDIQTQEQQLLNKLTNIISKLK
jgi:hypothetical protein